MKQMLQLMLLFLGCTVSVAPSLANKTCECHDLVGLENFEAKFNEAQDAGQPVIVFIYKKGCGWCDKQKEVYPIIAKEFKGRIFLLEFDGTNKENKAIFKLLGLTSVSAYPYMVMFDKEGNRVYSDAGFIDEDELRDHAETLLKPKKKATDKKKQMSSVCTTITNVEDFNQAVADAKDKGLPILLSIGGEHCSICKKMEPHLYDIAQDYEGQLVVILTDGDEYADVRDALASLIRKSMKGFNEFAGWPTIVTIDAQGKVTGVKPGGRDRSELDAEARAVMGGRPSAEFFVGEAIEEEPEEEPVKPVKKETKKSKKSKKSKNK